MTNEKIDWSKKELVIENNRMLSRWGLRLAYMVQMQDRIFLSNVILFTGIRTTKHQFKSVLTYMVQTEYQIKLINVIKLRH